MIQSHRKLVVGDKVSFECLICGRCCSSGPNVGLTAFDILRIASYLGVGWRELRGKYVVAVIADFTAIPVLKDRGGGVCVFLEILDGKPRCRIYPARPMRCRLYPFIPYSPGDKGTLYLDECCPGTKTNRVVEPPWDVLQNFLSEVGIHYSRVYSLTFGEGLEPLEALERTIEEIACSAWKAVGKLEPAKC
ncbi:MAG: YkgJ family cysteine cluster protein [Candidatus Bathyarchaeia archaeon]